MSKKKLIMELNEEIATLTARLDQMDNEDYSEDNLRNMNIVRLKIRNAEKKLSNLSETNTLLGDRSLGVSISNEMRSKYNI